MDRTHIKNEACAIMMYLVDEGWTTSTTELTATNTKLPLSVNLPTHTPSSHSTTTIINLYLQTIPISKMSAPVTNAAAAQTTSKFQSFMNHPAGPKYVLPSRQSSKEVN